MTPFVFATVLLFLGPGAFLLAGGGACGSPSSRVVDASDDQLADIGLQPSVAQGPQDLVVATVDGRPIWSSCVVAQAMAHRLSAAQAVAQCINFDLLAAASATFQVSGTTTNTSAQMLRREQHTAMVSRLIAKEFESAVPNWDSLPPAFGQRILDKNKWRLVRENYRESYFLRFEVAEDAPIDGVLDRQAKEGAGKAYETLKDRHGLFAADLIAISQQPWPAGLKVAANSAAMADPQRLVKPYSDALFAIRQIGDVSPPTRTKWGWDIILFTDELAPRTLTERQLQEELFPEVRMGYFQVWAGSLAKSLQVKVQIDPSADQVLESTISGSGTPADLGAGAKEAASKLQTGLPVPASP
jgi:hypothetical protein